MSIKKKFVQVIFTAAVTLMTTITGFADVYPEVEPNNTKESAQQVTSGSQTITEALKADTSRQYYTKGDLNSSEDVDWYKVSLVPFNKNYLTVNRYSGSTNNQTKFEFYSSEGEILGTFEYTSNQILVFRLPTNVAQTYYLKVSTVEWTGNLTYVMQMGNPEPEFKSLYYKFPSSMFGKNYPNWSGTWDLSKTNIVPKDAQCYNINLAYLPTGSYNSMNYKNDVLSWRNLSLAGNDLIPSDSLKARQKWQFKADAKHLASDKKVTPEATLRFVYLKLPVDEMQY